MLPRLERNYEVRYLRRGEEGLLKTLQQALSTDVRNVPIETTWRAKEEQLKKPLIVFLDQVEELYARPIADLPDELDQLLKAVKAVFGDPQRRPNGKLVLGFRKEWLAELESQLVAYELPRTKVFLEPLDRRGIIDVVCGPARSARLRERYPEAVDSGLLLDIVALHTTPPKLASWLGHGCQLSFVVSQRMYVSSTPRAVSQSRLDCSSRQKFIPHR